jgi:hypothetical protein
VQGALEGGRQMATALEHLAQDPHDQFARHVAARLGRRLRQRRLCMMK